MYILVFVPLFWESRLWNLNCYWSKNCLSPVPAGCEETYSPLTYRFHLFSHQVSDSLQPHGPQYARSPCPWPSPKWPAVFSFHPVWSHGFLYEKIWPTLSATPGVCKLHRREDREMVVPILLPGKSHGQRSLKGYSPWGRKESDTTEWLHFHFLGL